MIAFFAREPFFINKPSGKTLQRISTIVRGKQMAKYLGAKYNPTCCYKKDTCIYLKPRILDVIKDGDYVDVLDDVKLTKRIGSRPGINVIAMTTEHAKWLRSFLPNKVIHIPHYHMNFERARRKRKTIKVCGYVGANKPMHRQINRELKKKLEKAGFEFKVLYSFETRQDIVKFYKSIDIQVIGMFNYLTDAPQYHEKKIVDAMSYGIPTVAEPKLGYRDVRHSFLHAHNTKQLIERVLELKDKKTYKQWSDRVYNEAERYHIDNVSKIYENLSHRT